MSQTQGKAITLNIHLSDTLPPARLHILKKCSSPNSTANGDQVFKYASLPGTFFIQAIKLLFGEQYQGNCKNISIMMATTQSALTS